MASTPVPELQFQGRCPDCGTRSASLPQLLPDVGDDFDWNARDYDRFRVVMLEELASRFVERTRWTPADIEVVLVEVLAAALDQLSDMADRVHAEAFLETARRPESLRRMLMLIGYDAARVLRLDASERDIDPDEVRGRAEQELERLWADDPVLMEHARRAGPRAVRTQRRMVTIDDYARRLEEHPLVMRAAARAQFSGSWMTVRVAAILPQIKIKLDASVKDGADSLLTADVREAVAVFHEQRGLVVPDWNDETTPRTVLRPYLDAYRMVGHEVLLLDAVFVPIVLNLTVVVGQAYFQTEVRRVVEGLLGTQPGGFFEPGRQRFGEDLHASDFFQLLMSLDGVDNVCLDRFKRFGRRYPDRSGTGVIELRDLEVAVCDNDSAFPGRGFYHLAFRGGRRG